PVEVIDLPVRTRGPDDLRNSLRQAAIALLAALRFRQLNLLANSLRPLLVGVLTIRNVLSRAVDAAHAGMGGVPNRLSRIAQPAHFLVFGYDAKLGLIRTSEQQLLAPLLDLGAVARMNYRQQNRLFQIHGRVTGDAREGLCEPLQSD